MPHEEYISGREGDDCIWTSGCIVQKLVDIAHGVSLGGCLLGGDRAKGGEHRAVDCAAIVEGNPEYFM